MKNAMDINFAVVNFHWNIFFLYFFFSLVLSFSFSHSITITFSCVRFYVEKSADFFEFGFNNLEFWIRWIRTKHWIKHSKFHKVFCGFRFGLVLFSDSFYFSVLTALQCIFCVPERKPQRCMHLVCGGIIIDSNLYAQAVCKANVSIYWKAHTHTHSLSPFYLFTYFVNILNGRLLFFVSLIFVIQ